MKPELMTMTKGELVNLITTLTKEVEEKNVIIEQLEEKLDDNEMIIATISCEMDRLNNIIKEQQIKSENEELQEQTANTEWCSIGISGFSGNYAYIPIMNKKDYNWKKELSNAWYKYIEFLVDNLSEEAFDKKDSLSVEKVINRLIEEMKPVLGIKKNYNSKIGIYGGDVIMHTKHHELENWYASIDKRYGEYLKTHGYDYWLEQGVDLNKPVAVEIEHACMRKLDQHNLHKQFIDYIYETMKENSNGRMTGDDNLIDSLTTKRIANSEEFYHTSEIRWRFYNIEPVKEQRKKANWYLGKKVR